MRTGNEIGVLCQGKRLILIRTGDDSRDVPSVFFFVLAVKPRGEEF